MPTTRQEFIDLAAELIGDEFADFRGDALIEQATSTSYGSQGSTTQQQTRQMIPLEYEENQIDGTLVKTGDIMLIGEFQLFEWTPSLDNSFVTFSLAPYDKKYTIKKSDIDPAAATITLQCRPV